MATLWKQRKVDKNRCNYIYNIIIIFMIPKIIVIMFLLVMLDIIQFNSHTMVHTNAFVVDLNLHTMH
jgi:type IV secretory pathway component VirB8